MQDKLIINNDICKLSLKNDTIIDVLYNSLRFRDPDCFHNPAYKLFIKSKGRHGWDGYVSFFNKETGKFATGILPEIIRALAKTNQKVEIEDNRSEKIIFNKITPDYIDGIELYDYQVEIANKSLEMERGIIKSPTASGKTLLFTAMIKAIPEKTPILILFRNKTLVTQTYDVLVKNGISNVGKISGDFFEPDLVLCATIQSYKNYEKLLPQFKVLIVDECHEFATNKSIGIFKKLKNCRYRFGFSATPWSEKDKIKKYRLKSWFGPLVGNIEIKTLQERNILSQAQCFFHVISKPEELYADDYQSAYKIGITENTYFHNKIKEIVDSYKNGRILIVVDKIAHGDILSQIIPGSLWVQGKDDEETRRYVIEKLSKSKDNEKVVAIASRIMQTGVNIFVHAVINAAGYKSYIMTIQRIGRGLRVAPDKDKLNYHDFIFTNNIYLKEHSEVRIKWLKKEGHNIKLIGENDENFQ
jgi:superfamily II DNA or RNA helicase